MKNDDHQILSARLKQLITDQFRLDLPGPELISDHEPLIGGSLGLDSLDAIELAMRLEEEFGVTIPSREESLSAFASITTLAAYIHARTAVSAQPIAGAAAA